MNVPQSARSHWRFLSLIASILVLAGAITLAFPVQQQNQVGIKGQISVYEGGKLVGQGQDVLSYYFVNLVVCALFNNTGNAAACSALGAEYSGFTNACQYYSTGNTYLNNYYGASLCSALGVVLSSQTSTPAIGSYTCNSQLTSNGFTAKQASQGYTLNTGVIVLSASWTPTQAQSGIDTICLFPYNWHAATVVIPANGYALAMDLLPGGPYTAQLGIPFSITWQFSLTT